MSQAFTTEDIRLALGDRINYPYILGGQLMAILRAVNESQGVSLQQLVNRVEIMKNLFPTSWHDSDWTKEIKECYDKVLIDIRPMFCGIRVGPLQVKEDKKLNFGRLLNACVNLLDRRDLLAKKLFTEWRTGRSFKERGLKDVKDIPE